MQITTLTNATVNLKPEEIRTVDVNEDYNRFGAHALINSFYVTEREFSRINRENGNILLSKARG